MLSNRPPMQPFCVNTVSPLRLSGYFSYLASPAHQSRLPLQPAADTCSSSPVDAWWHSAAMLGDWVQSPRSDHPIQDPCSRSCWTFPLSARHLHANSLPSCQPASQPASLCLAHRYHQRAECHARPLHASREASACRTLHTPSSLCTCMLACQTAANNDVAGVPSGSSCVSFPCLVVYYHTTPYYFSVPAFVLP